jgi:hypothetical protein
MRERVAPEGEKLSLYRRAVRGLHRRECKFEKSLVAGKAESRILPGR